LIAVITSILIAFLTIFIFLSCFVRCPLAMIKVNVGFFMLIFTAFSVFVTFKVTSNLDPDSVKFSGTGAKENGKAIIIGVV
jgi:uncharacterized membrane protein YobD (UPF0266 family)